MWVKIWFVSVLSRYVFGSASAGSGKPKASFSTKLQLSGSDDGRQKLKKNIYASYSMLGGATYFNAVRSSIKIIQVQESAGAQAAQSSDGTNIQKKEI